MLLYNAKYLSIITGFYKKSFLTNAYNVVHKKISIIVYIYVLKSCSQFSFLCACVTLFYTGSSSSTRNSRRSTWSVCVAAGPGSSRLLLPAGSDWALQAPTGCRWMAVLPSPTPIHSRPEGPPRQAKLRRFGCLWKKIRKL